jgi:hypothetical protein
MTSKAEHAAAFTQRHDDLARGAAYLRDVAPADTDIRRCPKFQPATAENEMSEAIASAATRARWSDEMTVIIVRQETDRWDDRQFSLCKPLEEIDAPIESPNQRELLTKLSVGKIEIRGKLEQALEFLARGSVRKRRDCMAKLTEAASTRLIARLICRGGCHLVDRTVLDLSIHRGKTSLPRYLGKTAAFGRGGRAAS